MAKTYTPIAPPDVEVRVETVTLTPTVSPAVLPAVVIGPCYEIVEVLDSDGSTNEDARVYLPASIKSQELDLTVALGLGGSLVATFPISVNNGPDYDVDFDSLPTAADYPIEVVNYFNNTLQVPGLRAVLLPGSTGKGYILIETTGTGTSQSIELETVPAAVVAALAGEWHDIDKYGSSQYNQWFQDFTPRNYPNPNNLDVDELSYLTDDIDAYMDIGSSLKELQRDEAVERYGTAQMEWVEDGDLDGVSPILRLYEVKAGGPNATPAASSVAALLSADVNSTESICTVVGGVVPGPVNLTVDGVLRLSIDGSQIQDIELTNGMTPAQVATEVNKYFSHVAASVPAAFQLVSALKGSEGSIYIQPAPSGNDNQILVDLGLIQVGPPAVDQQGYHFGDWFAVKKQDELWINGELRGVVTKVYARVAGPPTYTDVKIDTEYVQTEFATPATQKFHFVSKNLGANLPDPLNTEPTPEFYIDDDGNIRVKHNILRDIYGVPMFPANGELYLGYKALRVDVSADAENPKLIEISSDDDITSNLGEIRTDNPLAYAAWLCRNLGCPDRVMYALGVGAISDDLPDGTLPAYTSAFEYLENWEVYTLATLTQERTVHDAGQVHVDTMSLPENKAERIYFGTIEQPLRAPDTVAISGTDGNTTAVANEFNTGRPGITQALLDLGVDITKLNPTLTDAEEVYLDIETDALNYRVLSISGQVLTVVPATGSPSWNADGFYATTALATPLIHEAWSLKVRGAELVTALGAPDKNAIARAIADICDGYDDKRVFIGYPGETTLTDPNGLEQLLPSYYLAAITAGQIAQQAPQQPFSFMRVPGAIAVRGSSDYFSKEQLNIIAGGGCWIWYQETPSSAVEVRHQLSTKTATVLEREFSLTKAIDYVAKFFRRNCRPLVGRFNITEELLEMLASVCEGCRCYLTETIKVLKDCNITSIEVVAVDEIEVVVDITPYYPLNKITIRIRV